MSFSHPAGETSDQSESGSLMTAAYLCAAVGTVGYLNLLGAPDGVRVLRWFFLLALAAGLLAGVQTLTTWVRSRLRSRKSLDGDTAQLEPDTEDPRAWIKTGFDSNPLAKIRLFVMILHPNVLFRSILQIVGGAVALLRHRGTLLTPETYEGTTTYHPPFSGEWTILNGSPDPDYSHSWFPVRQRYAYDFVMTDEEGRTHSGNSVKSFYCFDEPVLAPAEGTVARVKDGHRDYHRTGGQVDPLQYRLAGNYVLIKHAESEYSFLAHLKKGSICVSAGDEVAQGQEIGRCGHSGNSTEPHLHFHVQDHSFPYVGAGIPIQIDGKTKRPESTDSPPVWAHCGQLIVAPE